ncbi:hypothetical protein EMIT013CA1_250022 [Bacillus sp. IT-13CA1]
MKTRNFMTQNRVPSGVSVRPRPPVSLIIIVLPNDERAFLTKGMLFLFIPHQSGEPPT